METISDWGIMNARHGNRVRGRCVVNGGEWVAICICTHHRSPIRVSFSSDDKMLMGVGNATRPQQAYKIFVYKTP